MLLHLRRISELIPDEKNIVKLAKVLKLLHEITTDLESSGRYYIKHPDYGENLLELPQVSKDINLDGNTPESKSNKGWEW